MHLDLLSVHLSLVQLGNTALHESAYHNHVSIVGLLLQRKAYVNFLNRVICAQRVFVLTYMGLLV